MQLTSPVFLFLFLPLCLPVLPLCPARYRRTALALLSLAWFLLVHRSAPWSLVQIALVALITCILSALPDRAPRVRCAVGVILPLGILIAARLLAEYAPFDYRYPTGLGMVVLASISVSIDRYRGDAPEREGPLAVLSYLLFFPTMLVGPILRYKQFLYVTDHIAPSRAGFAHGSQLYMLGFVKRIAVAAVLLRAIKSTLLASGGAVPASLLLLLLAMSYLLLVTFLSGTNDMARGLMLMLGLHPSRGRDDSVALLLPHRLLYAMLVSLDRYLQDYVIRPLTAVMPRRSGKLLSAILLFVLTLLFYRTRPEMLLLASPLLLFALLSWNKRRWKHFPRRPIARLLMLAVSVVLLSLPSLGLLLEDPLDTLALIRNAFVAKDTFSFHYLYGTIRDAGYLLACLAVAMLLPVLRCVHVGKWHLPERAVLALRLCVSLAIIAAFAATLIYFFPQFPNYAELPFGSLVI